MTSLTYRGRRHLDVRTGRPYDGETEAIETLTDSELEREITIAALASRRIRRYDALLKERQRRRERSTPNR